MFLLVTITNMFFVILSFDAKMNSQKNWEQNQDLVDLFGKGFAYFLKKVKLKNILGMGYLPTKH